MILVRKLIRKLNEKILFITDQFIIKYFYDKFNNFFYFFLYLNYCNLSNIIYWIYIMK
jgi:hypothetical protein